MQVRLENQRATELFAADIAELLQVGDVLALSGDLGTGKSTFSRALLRHLAANPELEVPSPTFTLVQTYDLPRVPVAHFDLYRIEEPEELEELGLEEYLEGGVALIEWPEMGDPMYWPEALEIKLTEGADPDSRVFELTANSENWQARLDRLKDRRDLLLQAGWHDANREFLHGDASSRSYQRLRKADETAVFMDSPAVQDEPVLASGRTYGETVHRAQNINAFLAIADTLQNQGFVVPELLSVDTKNGLALLGDLGGETILKEGQPVIERYEAAVDVLSQLHACEWDEHLNSPYAEHTLHPADSTVLITEAELYLHWYLPYATGEQVSEAQQTEFWEAWQELLQPVLNAEKTLLLRDYHSPNLMWLPEADKGKQIGLIDFQDALLGPTAYDLASLIYDARTDMPAELQERLLERYCASARKNKPAFDEIAFQRAVAILALQRNAKILGAFVRLDKHYGKPKYMGLLPRIRTYAQQALTQIGDCRLKPLFHVIFSSTEQGQTTP